MALACPIESVEISNDAPSNTAFRSYVFSAMCCQIRISVGWHEAAAATHDTNRRTWFVRRTQTQKLKIYCVTNKATIGPSISVREKVRFETCAPTTTERKALLRPFEASAVRRSFRVRDGPWTRTKAFVGPQWLLKARRVWNVALPIPPPPTQCPSQSTQHDQRPNSARRASQAECSAHDTQ